LEGLRGDRKGQRSIRINDQWRICFIWRECDVGGGMAKKLMPVHPGEILSQAFRKPYALSMNKLALELRVPVTRIADIVAERRGITSDAATPYCNGLE
jgi:addiction module HigA family antidote